jgi:hypothetical protein
MNMKENLLQKAEELGLRVYHNYSGRGMFGKTCIGVVGSMEDLDCLLGEVKGAGRGLRKDSLGLDYIYYWPALS